MPGCVEASGTRGEDDGASGWPESHAGDGLWLEL